MLFFLPSFLPGKQRIGMARRHPLKELPLGMYLAFKLDYMWPIWIWINRAILLDDTDILDPRSGL